MSSPSPAAAGAYASLSFPMELCCQAQESLQEHRLIYAGNFPSFLKVNSFGSSAGFHVDEGVKARYWINPDKKVLEILHAEFRSKQEMALLLCQNLITI
uniref:Uncharacterized protein n=1 Tax=Oryza barthii TaxID=65489 RepID=A0A0D3GU90_9ORYZ